jgi:hypothetical protein
VPSKVDVDALPLLVSEQEHLNAYVSTVYGPVEFREWKRQLERIHGILGLSGVEETFQRNSSSPKSCTKRKSEESCIWAWTFA